MTNREKMAEWWSNPENKESVRRAKLEARARRLGTTPEALDRPRAWAPRATRLQTYRDLFLEGHTHHDVIVRYPREQVDVIQEGYIQAKRMLKQDTDWAREQRARIRSQRVKEAWTPEKRKEHSARVREGLRRSEQERQEMLSHRRTLDELL